MTSSGLRACLLCALLSIGCPGGAARPVAPAAADPWQRVEVPHTALVLYAYPDTITAYAPDDRGAYVVRIGGDEAARRALAAELGAADDLIGDDGYVARLGAAEATALSGRAGVVAVTPLQPRDRLGAMIDRTVELPEIRVDLFADARPDEVEAVAAWIVWRGGTVSWRGRTALRARVPLEARTEAARLSVVRWIE